MDKYNELKEEFEANRNDENATKMAAYMRNLFVFYGLPTPKRKSIYKEFLRAEKTKKVVDWDLLDRCYADEHREFHYFVMDYLVAMQKFLTYDDVPHIKRYIKTNQWWDTIDGLDRIVGNIAFFDERINNLMLEGAVIVLACIIFSLFASSPPVINPDAVAVTQVWSYIGELVFNMLFLSVQ